MAHLEMKSSCEKCKQPIAAESECFICSYECTFCCNCAVAMGGTCPNCGGELAKRPLRNMRLSPAFVAPQDLSVLKNRIWVVCLASLAAWMFIGISAGVSMYEFDRSFGHPANLRMEFTLPIVNYLIFAFLTPFVFFMARRHPIQRNNWGRRVLLYLAGGLAFTTAHVALRCLVYPVWDPRIDGFTSAVWNSSTHVPQVKWILVQRLFLYNSVDDIASVYLGIVLIAHAVLYYQNFREREVRATQLESQLTKTRLKALKSQMQPHFLFNTMHSISALMLIDVPAADKMITRLSDFLRINLDNDDLQFTSLNRELEFAHSYLEIEKVRFEERLNLVFNIAPDTLDVQVPHLLLQPLVENAIQHGISRLPQGGELRITSCREDSRLHITVKDNGPGPSESERNRLTGGRGLKATRERLQTIYGDDHTFEVCSPLEGGFEVEFWIPLRVDKRLMLAPAGSLVSGRA